MVSIQTSPSDFAWAMLPLMAEMSAVAYQRDVVGPMLCKIRQKP